MTSPESTEGFIDHNDARIHYTSHGQGPVLAFVHAGIADCRMWQPQIEHFSSHYRVITFDLRGYGQTAMVAGEYSNADDLKAVLDAFGIEKAAILGCSMGGSAAINFTLQNPQRVQALIPICAGVDGYEVEDTADSEAQWQQAMEAEKQKDFDRYAEIIVHLWIDGPRRKPEEVNPAVRAFVKEMLRTSFDTPEGLGIHVRPTPPAVERLGEIHTPTLVIAGKEDVPEMAPFAEKLAADIPGARLVVLANAGHLPNLERPAEFNRLLEGFLNEVLGGGEK